MNKVWYVLLTYDSDPQDCQNKLNKVSYLYINNLLIKHLMKNLNLNYAYYNSTIKSDLLHQHLLDSMMNNSDSNVKVHQIRMLHRGKIHYIDGKSSKEKRTICTMTILHSRFTQEEQTI